MLPPEAPCSLLWTVLLPTPIDCTPPSWFIPWTTFLLPGSPPAPHTSLLVHSLDHTPLSWFSPWAELLPLVSLAGPNSTFHPRGSLSCVPTPPSWYTALGPHTSLLVHCPGPLRLPPCSLPWTPTLHSPSLFTPLDPHSSLTFPSPGPPLLRTPLGRIPPSWFTPLGPHSSFLGV